MSGETSPQPGSGLEVPQRPAAADPGGSPRVPRSPAPPPSLLHVLGTTLRLWLRRRVLRLPDGAKLGGLRWAAVTVVVVLAVAGAAGGVATSLHASPPASRVASHATRPRLTPEQARAVANERTAAAWVVAQLATGTSVACAPAMCADLEAAGWPAASVQAVTPGSTLPAGSVLVASPAVLGPASSGPAVTPPEVIASFGTGQAAVQVLTGSGSADQFRTAARAALVAARWSGWLLAHNRRVHLSDTAWHQLVSGLVDRRLVVVLRQLAAVAPVYVAGFGDAAPGAAWPAELRSVTLTRLNRGTGRHRVRDLWTVLEALRAMRAPDNPMVHELPGPGGTTWLSVGFPAPSPL